ncbi:MAG TPA: aminoglycoside phosphotransferase family protein, partial [Marmoricola sp.]
PALSRLPEVEQQFPAPAYELHDVAWVPGGACRLSYRVRTPERPASFVAVRLDRAGWSAHSPEADSALPGLREALDPEAVQDRLADLTGTPRLRCRITPVRYRPGDRCVLRYDVEAPAGARTFYAKVFRPETFADLVPRVVPFSGVAAEAGLAPAVEAVWSPLHTLVTSAVPGRSAASVLADEQVGGVERVRLAFRLGEVLARFHEVDAVPAPEWSATEQVARIRELLLASWIVDAAQAARMATVLDTLERTPPPDARRVLCHGGFRAGNVVVHGHELVVLDVDGLCVADPGRDLGTVLAQLTWQDVREPRTGAPADLGEAVVAGYEQRAGVVAPDTVAWWQAAGLLQVAARRHRRLETASWSSVPALVDAAEELVDSLGGSDLRGFAVDPLDTGTLSKPVGRALAGRIPAQRTYEIDAAEELSRNRNGRVVVRYQLHGAEETRPLVVVGKAFREPHRARLLHEHLRQLNDGPFAQGRLRVPEPLGFLPGQRLVLFHHCGGAPLSLITDPERAVDGVRLAAQWLARLHASDTFLPRSWSLAREEGSTRVWATLIAGTYPELAALADELARGWSAGVSAAAVDVEVPIHKDFHAGHVLVGEDVYVVDLDEARRGDPALDVAHFCTYLQAMADGPAGGDRSALEMTFLEEYADATGWSDQGSFRSFCAYSWLKVAKQRASRSGPFRPIPAAERRILTAEALHEGLTCLDV